MNDEQIPEMLPPHPDYVYIEKLKELNEKFPKGPDTTPPDNETLEQLGLTSEFCGETHYPKPFYCDCSMVWAAGMREDLPVYAIYYNGTNNLLVLEKSNGTWKRIELNQIDNLYGFICKMIAQIETTNYRLKMDSIDSPCVSYIVKSWGKAHPSCIYLRDGTKITVGRDKTTTGPAWLEISKQDSITAK